MKFIKVTLVLLIFIMIHTGCGQNATGKTANKSTNINYTNKISYQVPIRKIPDPHPLEIRSRKINETLPWNNNPNFIKAVKDNATPILMGNFKATLHDPIGGEIFNISHAADLLAGQVIKPEQVFSQNTSIGPYTKERGFKSGPMYVGNSVTTAYGGGVCKIATLLFNVVILSDLEIIQRFTHSMTVPYVPAGQDATVYYGAKDFVFKNNTDGNVLIWAQMVDKTLYMAMYGTKRPPTVTWHHEILRRTPSWNIYRTNNKLKQGTQNTITEGHEGIVVRSSISTIYEGGTKKTTNFGIKYYAPCPSLIERN